jgi:hypothetical protein
VQTQDSPCGDDLAEQLRSQNDQPRDCVPDLRGRNDRSAIAKEALPAKTENFMKEPCMNVSTVVQCHTDIGNTFCNIAPTKYTLPMTDFPELDADLGPVCFPAPAELDDYFAEFGERYYEEQFHGNDS